MRSRGRNKSVKLGHQVFLLIRAYLALDKKAGELLARAMLACLFLWLQMDIAGFWRTDCEPKSICFQWFLAGLFVLVRAERGTAVAAIGATAGGGLPATSHHHHHRLPAAAPPPKGYVRWLYLYSPCSCAAAFSSNRGEKGLGGGSV